MKRLLPLVLSLFLAAGTAWAATAQPQDALKMVKQTADQMLTALRTHHDELQQHPDRIYDLVQKIVLPHFDFETISRWVLGKYWRRATPQQRQRFTDEFRTLLVRTYAKALLDYSDQKIVYKPLQAAANADDVTVRSEVQRNDGPPVPMNYELHYKSGAWKVYDVNIDGISLVTNYRSSLGSQIEREGLDAIISKLHQRNNASGGTG